MLATKNWAFRVADLVIYAGGDGYRIKHHPGSLSGQTPSAVRQPYKDSIDPKTLDQKTQEVNETYHPDYFDGRAPRSVIARDEARRLLTQGSSDSEEKMKKGTQMPGL